MNKILNNVDSFVKKHRELTKTTLIFLILVPFFKLGIFNEDGTFLDYFYNIARVIVSLFILIRYISYSIKNKYISKTYIVFFITRLYVFLNTTIQYGLNKDSLMNFMLASITLLIVDFYSHKDSKEFIHAILLLFELLIISNFILMLCYPKGFPLPNNVHLLGNRNSLITYFLLAFIFSLIWCEYGGSKIHFYVLLPICLISAFIGNSTTGYFVMFLFLLFYFSRLYKCKKFSFSMCIIIYLLLFVFVVILRIQDNLQPLWRLFGKSATFSNRTVIWDTILNNLFNKPIFGYGQMPDTVAESVLSGYGHAHNLILNYYIEGGIINLILLTLFIISINYSIKDVKAVHTTKIILLAIMPFLLTALVSYFDIIDYIMFILLDHAKDINQSININKQK